MNIRPRADEYKPMVELLKVHRYPDVEQYVSAIVAILDSDKFEAAEDMAFAILRVVADFEYNAADAESLAKALLMQAYTTLLERDWWLTIVDLDGVSVAYGLSATEVAAEKLEAGKGWRRAIIPVSSVVKHAERMALLEAPPTIKEQPVKRGR